MDKELNDNMPIYMQIMDRIRSAVISGEMAPGGKIKSVRELAETFQVNPNTMQRALSELEREQILVSERTTGRFVTDDKTIIENARNTVAKKVVDQFLAQMKALGFSEEEIQTFFIDEQANEYIKGAV